MRGGVVVVLNARGEGVGVGGGGLGEVDRAPLMFLLPMAVRTVEGEGEKKAKREEKV